MRRRHGRSDEVLAVRRRPTIRWVIRSPALHRVVDFVLPTGCVVCRAWIPLALDDGRARSIVCERCRSRLARASWPRCPRCHAPCGTGRSRAVDCLECREWPSELTRARYAHVLVPPATDLVHALKYEGWREVAGTMGAAMAETAVRHVEGLDAVPGGGPATHREDDWPDRWIVVPVPTTSVRRKERGYNQAELLADVVASRLGLPKRALLERVSAPTSQTALSPAARRENVRGAFRALAQPRRGERLADVLLVDDVLTTGATAAEAARSLTDAGARSVSLITFGRALPRGVGADPRRYV